MISKLYLKDSLRRGYLLRKTRWVTVTAILIILTLFLASLMLMHGKTNYSLATVIKVILGDTHQGASFAINTLRLPRMLAGVLAGIAFGMAGYIFQTMLRNPLASPDIIGVTSGSSVAAVFCILVLKMSGNTVSVISVISGLMVASFLYSFTRRGGFSGGRLILIGIGIQAMIQATISFLMMKASQYDIQGAMRWLSGSLNGVRMKSITGLFLVVVIVGVIMLFLEQNLKIMELGEESAVTLGLKSDQTRLLLMICSVCLVAFATSVTGPIAFVAFLSGPIATGLAGKGLPNVIPSGLVGASLVLGSDLIGQFALQIAYPVGVITGILGTPYLLYLLVKMNRKGGFI